MLAFYTDIFFQMLTIIQEDKYNYLHVHRWESWSIERLADSVRSLSQHFNLYLSDSTCSTCQCSTVSISIFAFRARSDDILGYYQIFFSEVCTQSLASCNILSVQGQSSFYVSALVAIYFAQSHHERGSWGRKYVALSPDWTGMIQNSGVVCIFGPAFVPGHMGWSSVRKRLPPHGPARLTGILHLGLGPKAQLGKHSLNLLCSQ